MAGRAGHFLDVFFIRIAREPALRKVQPGPVVLDAATGAGNCAIAVARMLERGRVITVDSDPEAWTGFARPKVEEAGLLERIEFRRADIADLSEFAGASFDAIVCGATLSAMGAEAADGIREFGRVAKPGAFLAVYDLLAQGVPQTRRQRNAVDAWRLSKAVDVLRGARHYEELSPEWISRRLRESGFAVEGTEVEQDWADASDESIREFLASTHYNEIEDPRMREAVAGAAGAVKERVRSEGMSNFSRRFSIFARRRGRGRQR